MSLKNKMNKTLAIGLTVGSVFVSAHTIYALNEDVNKEMVKTNNKIELNVDKKEEVKKESKIETTERKIVTTSVLNIRKEASKEAEVVGALKENAVVTILETKGEWSKIQLSDEVEGWINNEFISNETAKVNVDELNLRKEPLIAEDNKLEKLKRNIELEILGVVEVENKEEETTDMWYEVKVIEKEASEEETTEDKKEKIGFAHSDYVLTASEEAKLEEEARIKAEEEAKAKAKAKEEEAQRTVQAKSEVASASSNNTQSSESNKPAKEPVKEENTSANLAGSTITVNASAYSGHSITATGTVPKWGTIAVDPSVIPYGTKVYIPMFDKVFIAEDCGGAIKGNKIDIFMNSAEETKNFGRRNIEIKILG
ncbi:MAG: 3D domain-containing protein [Peptostreptococcaceae bacterium]